MIRNDLKECCCDCPDICGAFDTIISKNILEQTKSQNHIYCENMNICKIYAECDKKPENQNA